MTAARGCLIFSSKCLSVTCPRGGHFRKMSVFIKGTLAFYTTLFISRHGLIRSQEQSWS